MVPRSHGRSASGDDAQLVDACRRGDRAALSKVFSAHAAGLERLLARLVGPGADAEDLLQTTFEAAITAFPRFRGEAAVRTWLTRIAVHVVHEHLRRPERRLRVQLELVGGAEPADPAPPPDRAADARRQLTRLYEHLGALPPRRRIAFVLHVIEGRPLDEVAALVGASQLATRSRIFWARRALLKRLRRDPAFRSPLPGQEEDPR